MAKGHSSALGNGRGRAQSHSKTSFPIVGIGASAGGLAAFEAFFSGMPNFADPGVAFVVVQHLVPDHESMLTNLIQRYTNLEVLEVLDGMEVRPNCVYIIPPGRDMALLNGTLQLTQPSVHYGQRSSIDFFFRTLAQDLRRQSICIVLSGNGSDGTVGIRAVKGEGGMVMVQMPSSTEYAGMPSSAIATGLVDFVLSPAKMPDQLKSYVELTFESQAQMALGSNPGPDNTLKDIFLLLRQQTGHDFSGYKMSTINNGIELRRAIHRIDTMAGYLELLHHTPTELDALCGEILVGVTSFFRDPEAFRVLEELIIPKLFAGKPEGAAIRVWVPGCSTGEEAYSIAMLLQEHLDTLKERYLVQVFASDINAKAIGLARSGIYPESINADITAERLARFFTPVSAGKAYRMQKDIRDLLVFSEQNVTRDPPFSKVDLLSCRNLLIYTGNDLQKKILPLFHYALNPDGYLFLGTSETIDTFNDLFKIINRKAKLYQRKHSIHSVQRVALSRFLPSMRAEGALMPRVVEKKPDLGKLSLRELTERSLLQHTTQTGALVNSHGDILYLHGRTGMYLEPTNGDLAVNNILTMARQGLRHELANALLRATATMAISHHRGLMVSTNSGPVKTNLTVRPLITGPAATGEAPLFLIVLEEVELESSEHSFSLDIQDVITESKGNEQLVSLSRKLQTKEELLQRTNDTLAIANERLNYSQVVNEELKSTNEELETAKEEVQSINEQLVTVNTELQSKVADLLQANTILDNYLSGTGISTIFVDHGLHILRFTPTATRIINLRQSDIGRFIGHVVSTLVNYDQLVVDIQLVLTTLVAREADVQTSDGKWYTMRILPYRTLNTFVEGAVITFVDISNRMDISGQREPQPVL
jgi:two-component system CheB/CheR fusion protein